MPDLDTPAPYAAELSYRGQPPVDVPQALAVLTMCGLPTQATDPRATDPEPADLEAGIWLIYLNGAQRHWLHEDGELCRMFGPGTYVTVTI